MLISKTTFLSFLECPKNVWLQIHRPDLVGDVEFSDFELHLMEQGNEVEIEARKLFPEAVHITSTEDDAVKETKELVEAKTKVIFQATFVADGFIAKNDVLAYDVANDVWDLYEVKGTNSVKESSGSERDHIDDLAFQSCVLRKAGIAVGKCFVIHLNREYIRVGDIDLKNLFIIEDVTEKVSLVHETVEDRMNLAKEYLGSTKEPVGGCECIYKARKKHCTSFHISNPHVPAYSVHDLTRVSKKKLDFFIENNIFDLKDIPEDFELTENQKNQVTSHVLQKPMINKENIKSELDSLVFPLYFFDYEAFGPAVPAFSGYGPYKHIPFQFSLHILDSPDAEPVHVEFLHDNLSDPSTLVAEMLQKYVRLDGTVIVWYQHFEKMVNKEIAGRVIGSTNFFEKFSGRIYDLMEIFHNQHYVHPGFKGKSSIKKVLPVLAPELRYDVLDICEGGQASEAWWKMVTAPISKEEKEKIAKDLKIYCGLDTYAMYAIWKHLYKMTKDMYTDEHQGLTTSNENTYRQKEG